MQHGYQIQKEPDSWELTNSTLTTHHHCYLSLKKKNRKILWLSLLFYELGMEALRATHRPDSEPVDLIYKYTKCSKAESLSFSSTKASLRTRFLWELPTSYDRLLFGVSTKCHCKIWTLRNSCVKALIPSSLNLTIFRNRVITNKWNWQVAPSPQTGI